MNCDQVREILFQSADSDLPDQLRRDLDAHVAECRSCADEAEALWKEWNALRSLPQVKAPADLLDRIHERLGRRRDDMKAGKRFSAFFSGRGLLEATGLAVSALLVVVIYHAVTREMTHPTAPGAPPSVESPAKVESVQREGANGRTLSDAPQPHVSAPALAPAERALQAARPAVMTLTLTIPVDRSRKKEGGRSEIAGRDADYGQTSVTEYPEAIASALERIRQLIGEAQGRVVKIEAYESVDPGGAWVAAEMPVEAFPGFFSRLKQLGNIHEAKNGGIEQQPGPTVQFNLKISAAGD